MSLSTEFLAPPMGMVPSSGPLGRTIREPIAPVCSRPPGGRTEGRAVRTITTVHQVDPEDPADRQRLEALRTPRDDLVVAEERAGADRFTCAQGPFWEYERTLRVEGQEVTEQIRFALAMPGWSWVFAPLVRRELARPRPGARWWMPPDRFDDRTSVALSCLAALTLIAGFTGTLIGQTITFAADEFGASDRQQGTVLAVTRVGVLVALVLAAAADRLGRRRLIRI